MSRYGDDTTVISRTATRIVSPIIFVTAFALLLQGHNLPGGGFIAGVLTAAGFALIYIIFGLDYVQDTLLQRDVEPAFGLEKPAIAADYRAMFALGLLIAAGAGVVAMAYPETGNAFLGQHDWLYHVEPLWDFHFASAFAFDLGVYLVVVGGLLAIVSVVGAE
ncbi:MnhB domain-containing protein [Halorubellus sp. PRR65]|uniref:MnhB domain-containing protein n=1 Tax=Halorubellus sp. PRR65 TaxID=3098148 RepID=UPI002B261BC4|nr:MnhB domain-containing protein [Halorubellus sp. PRR65]